MKFTTTTLTTFAALLAATPTTLAAPTPQSSSLSSRILAATLSQYTVWTGAITSTTTARGKILKSGKTSDITTLATFDIPTFAAGRTCELVFPLDAAATVTGSGQLDVFTSLAPAAGSTTTSWPSGNLRDQFVGRAKAVKGRPVEWVGGFGFGGTFECPAGRKLAGELVGVGDVVDVEWDGAVAGPFVVVH